MILLVEDEPMIRMVLREILEDDGHTVVEAKDGAEARARFGPTIGAVLLDVRLPDADGIDLLQEFKAARPACPVVIMTGHGVPEVEASAMRFGANAFVHKPFDLDALSALVGRLVGAKA